MSKKFDIISIILIIVLIIMLFVVIFNYYTGSSSAVSNLNSPVDIEGANSLIYSGDVDSIIMSSSIDKKSGNADSQNIIEVTTIPENSQKSGESNASGEVSGENIQNEQQIIDDTPKQNTTPVIMTSTDDISSKEKKEVLKELDQTLMELLDVVDMVQTVDETRLITDDSEVGQ